MSSAQRTENNDSPAGRYVVNDSGERTAVILPIEEYERLLEALEELEDIQAFDESMSDPEESIPWEEAKRRLHVADPD